jgi:hypothetical protein
MFQHQKLSREEAIQAAAVKAVNALIDAGEHHLADAPKRLTTILHTMESRRLEHETLEQYNMVTDDGEHVAHRSACHLEPAGAGYMAANITAGRARRSSRTPGWLTVSRGHRLIPKIVSGAEIRRGGKQHEHKAERNAMRVLGGDVRA